MLIVGHITEINHVIENNFRQNNTSPQISNHNTTYTIHGYKEPFTIIIQRTPKSGQQQLDLNQEGDEIQTNGYTNLAIATSIELSSDSEIIKWYSMRTEQSENKIKELLLDYLETVKEQL